MSWDTDNHKKVFADTDKRRKDPVLKEKINKLLEAQNKALAEAVVLLEQATEILRANSGYDGLDIYERAYHAASMASYKVSHDANFLAGPANDCYLENMAAGRLGYQIEEMGGKFPL